MAKKNSFVVPKKQRKKYKQLVERANRNLRKNFNYIIDNKITNRNTVRVLTKGYMEGVQMYADRKGELQYFGGENWGTKKKPFSARIDGQYILDEATGEMKFQKFQSKAEYQDYIDHLEKWGRVEHRYELRPNQIMSDYKTSIIRALNDVKDQYSISTPDGKLPKEVMQAINSMTLEEVTNFFANGDPSEDIEVSQFNSDDFINVDTAEDFTSVVISRIYMVKKFNKDKFSKRNKRYIKDDIVDHYRSEHRRELAKRRPAKHRR